MKTTISVSKGGKGRTFRRFSSVSLAPWKDGDDDGKRTLANTTAEEKKKSFYSFSCWTWQVFAFLSLSPPFLSVRNFFFFFFFFLWVFVCVVWAPPALECGMHRRRPLEASFYRVYVCVCVCWMPPFCVLYLAKARLPVFSRPVQPERVEKKKKRKKVSTFLSFFLVPSVVWLPPSLQGLYSAALCAMSISNCVSFLLLLLSSIHFDR